MRILIAEDEPANRFLIKSCLEGIHQAIGVENGQECLEMFLKGHEAGLPYDLILLDIEMPVMDGQAALGAIREHERQMNVPPGSEVKVLMITAHDDQKNICKAFFKGYASGYLVKPVDRENLLGAISGLVSK